MQISSDSIFHNNRVLVNYSSTRGPGNANQLLVGMLGNMLLLAALVKNNY